MAEENKKIERLQVRANNLYRELINAIQAVDNATKRFYEKSSKYAKLLKKIEEEAIKKNDNSTRLSQKKKKTTRANDNNKRARKRG